jgi:hypothetical protein
MTPLGANKVSLFSTGAAVPSEFNIAGLVLYLDPNNQNGVTLNGSDIAGLIDLSGSGNDFAQASAPAQPALVASAFNGRSVARFAGAEYLSSSMSPMAASTKFIVYQNRTGTNGTLFSTDGASPNYELHRNNDTFPSAGAASIVHGGAGEGYNDNSVLQHDFDYTADNYEIVLDGVSVATSSAARSITTGNYQIGAAGISQAEKLSADIALIATYSRILTAPEVASIESRINTLFGLSI